MKKKSPPYAIIGAAILGIIAIGALFQYSKSQEAARQAAVDDANRKAQAALDEANKTHVAPVIETDTHVRPVLYATQPVEAGVKISAAFYEKKQTPIDILPDAYTDQQDIVGWYAIRRIEKGDPLSPRNIGKSLPYLSQRISPGMRAVSLPIFNGEVNNTGGFIVDGDKVDLLYSSKSEDSAFLLKTEVIMQNLSVLYVPGPIIKTEKTDGITPVPPPGDTISVTFEVTPEQAQALIFLSQVKNGKFSMILRGRRDTSQIKIKPFAADDYAGDWKKVQTMTDKSSVRVRDLATQIEAQEKTQGQGTNETTTPPPPKP